MRNALRDYKSKLSSLGGQPAAHVRDPRSEIEYLVQITEEPDPAGRYQITMLLCKPDEGVRFPDSIPHRTLTEIAADLLKREKPAPFGGNRYKGPDPSVLREMVDAGMTRQQISAKLERSPYTIDSWLKRARRMDPTFPTSLTKTGERRAPSKRQSVERQEMEHEAARQREIEAARRRIAELERR